MSQQQSPYQGGPYGQNDMQQQGSNWNNQGQGYQQSQNQVQYNNQNQGQYNNSSNNNQNGGNQGQYNNNQPPQYNDQNNGDYYDEEWGEDDWDSGNYGKKGKKAGRAGRAAGAAGAAGAKAAAGWSTGAIIMIAVAAVVVIGGGATVGILALTTNVFSSSAQNNEAGSGLVDLSVANSDTASEKEKLESAKKAKKQLSEKQATVITKAAKAPKLNLASVKEKASAGSKLSLRKHLEETHNIKFKSDESWEVEEGEVNGEIVKGLVLLVQSGYEDVTKVNAAELELAFCKKDSGVEEVNAAQKEYDTTIEKFKASGNAGLQNYAQKEAEGKTNPANASANGDAGADSSEGDETAGSTGQPQGASGEKTSGSQLRQKVSAAEQQKENMTSEEAKKKMDEDEKNWAKQSEEQAKLKKASEEKSITPDEAREIKEYRILEEDATKAFDYYFDKVCQSDQDSAVDQSALAMFFRPVGVTAMASPAFQTYFDDDKIEDLVCGCQITWVYTKGDSTEHERPVYFGLAQMKAVVEKWQHAKSPAPPKNEKKEKSLLDKKLAREQKQEQRKKDDQENDKKRKEDEQNWEKQAQKQAELKKAAEERNPTGEELREICTREEDASNAFGYYTHFAWNQGTSTESLDSDVVAMFHRPVEARITYSLFVHEYEDYDSKEYWVCGYRITWIFKKGDSEEKETRPVHLGPSEVKELVSKWKQAGSRPYPKRPEDDQERAAQLAKKETKRKERQDDESKWATQRESQEALKEAHEGKITKERRQQITEVHRVPEEEASKAFDYYLDKALNMDESNPDPSVDQSALAMFYRPRGTSGKMNLSYQAVASLEDDDLQDWASGSRIAWKNRGRERIVYFGPTELKALVEKWKAANSPQPAGDDQKRLEKKRAKDEKKAQRAAEEARWALQDTKQEKLKELYEGGTIKPELRAEMNKYPVKSAKVTEAVQHYSGLLLGENGESVPGNVKEILWKPIDATLSQPSPITVTNGNDECAGFKLKWHARNKEIRVVNISMEDLHTLVALRETQ